MEQERFLSKIPDVDLIILMDLDDRDLFNLCLTNTYTRDLCRNEDFWRNRSTLKYHDKLKYKDPSKTWKEFYLGLVSLVDFISRKSRDEARNEVWLLTLLQLGIRSLADIKNMTDDDFKRLIESEILLKKTILKTELRKLRLLKNVCPY